MISADCWVNNIGQYYQIHITPKLDFICVRQCTHDNTNTLQTVYILLSFAMLQTVDIDTDFLFLNNLCETPSLSGMPIYQMYYSVFNKACSNTFLVCD